MSSFRFQASRNPGTSPRVPGQGTFPGVSTSGTFPRVSTLGRFPRVQTSGTFPRVSTSGRFPRVSTPVTFPRVPTSGTFPRVSTPGTIPRVQASTPGRYPRVQASGTFPRVSSSGEVPWLSNAVSRAPFVNTAIRNGKPTQISGNRLDGTGVYGCNNATPIMGQQGRNPGTAGMDFKTLTSGTGFYTYPLHDYFDCLNHQQAVRNTGASSVTGKAAHQHKLQPKPSLQPAKCKPVTPAYFSAPLRAVPATSGMHPGNLLTANPMGPPLFLQTSEANPPKGFWVETVGPTSVTRTYYEHCGKPLLLTPAAKNQPGMQRTEAGPSPPAPTIMVTATGKSYPLPPCSTTYLSRRGWSKIGRMRHSDVAQLTGPPLDRQETPFNVNESSLQSQKFSPIVRDQVPRQRDQDVDVQRAALSIPVEDLEKGARDIQSEADSGVADGSKLTPSDPGSGTTDEIQTQRESSSDGFGDSVDQMSTSMEGPLKLCTLCRSNNETPKLYMSHSLTDRNGVVTCPVLRQHVCPHCRATGDYAHTKKYCPNLKHGYKQLQNPREGRDGGMRQFHRREDTRLTDGAYKAFTF